VYLISNAFCMNFSHFYQNWIPSNTKCKMYNQTCIEKQEAMLSCHTINTWTVKVFELLVK
jgi:hypothetical protein